MALLLSFKLLLLLFWSEARPLLIGPILLPLRNLLAVLGVVKDVASGNFDSLLADDAVG